MQTTAGADSLVEKLAKRVTDLADGNGVTRDAIRVTGTRVDRPMSLLLEVDFGWEGESRTLKGALQVEGSHHCDDEAAATEHLKLRCEALIAEPATAEGVAALVRAEPHARFSDLADEFEVDVGRVRSHHHSGCRRCGTKGNHRCTNLVCAGSGTTPCHCNDGKVSCGSCSYGTVYYTESYYDTNTKSTAYVSRQRTCGNCGGSGRTGTCWSCGGSSRIQCTTCRGDGWVYCSPCAATGWFTVAKQAWIVGEPKRMPSFPDDAPASFVGGVRLLPVRAIHGEHAETRFKFAKAKGGRVLAVFDCDMPHVSVEAAFGNTLTQVFEGFGAKATVVAMPVFLDELLAPAVVGIGVAVKAKDPLAAVRVAQEARAADDVLQSVSGARPGTAEEIAARHGGAVSPGLLLGLFDPIRRAYSGVGRASVRRDWLLFGIPVAAVAAALPLFGAGGHLLDAFPGIFPGMQPGDAEARVAGGLWLNLVAAASLSLVAWIAVGIRARRVVRAVVGEAARRRPGQGWWPTAGIAAAVTACLCGSAASGDMGILAAAVARQQQARAPEPSGGPSGSLEPPAAQIRGAPGVYRAQYLLAQLGFYAGPMDGQAGQGLRDAAQMLMGHVPRDALDRRTGASMIDIARAAVLGEFRMVGIMNSDGSPASAMSNVVRGSLTQDDVGRMNRAASAAAAAPGREEKWRSADGARSGTVKASPPTGNGCATLDAQVSMGKRSERADPRVFCPSGKLWVMQP